MHPHCRVFGSIRNTRTPGRWNTRWRDAIVRGRLPPGTTLSESGISTALGISRTPAREALAQLADEQLVLIFPQVKTVVAPVRRSLIDEGRFVRGTLECANHAELVTTIQEHQIAVLDVALLVEQRSAAKAGDIEAFFRLRRDHASHHVRVCRARALYGTMCCAKM